jgi:uncharacterized protein YdaU (DUF1376 family)
MTDPNEVHKVRSDGYYRFFPGDYLRDTMHISLIEDGAYRRLLDFYYSEERLPSDPERLYRICRATSPDERGAVDYVVGAFFHAGGDHLINRRAERELAWRRAFLDEQSRKGRLSGVARRTKRGTEGEPDVNRGSTGVQPGHEPEGEPNANRTRTEGATEGQPEVNPVSATALEPGSRSKPVPTTPPPNATKNLGGGIGGDLAVPKPRLLKPSSKKEGGNGTGTGKRYAAFLAELSPRKREALNHAIEKARLGDWPERACRRHLLDEGFEKKATRAMRFIVFPEAN